MPGLGDQGPDDLRALLSASFVLIGAGLVLGAVGHAIQVRPLVAAGVALAFAGTAFFVLAVGQFG